MTVIRWNPWREAVTLREAMNQLLEYSYIRRGRGVKMKDHRTGRIGSPWMCTPLLRRS